MLIIEFSIEIDRLITITYVYINFECACCLSRKTSDAVNGFCILPVIAIITTCVYCYIICFLKRIYDNYELRREI